MPEFTLCLRHCSDTMLPACAWYLPTANCDEWLNEIAGWNIEHAELKLLPIPTSAADSTVRGALVFADSSNIATSPMCIPYARIAERCYLPLDANLQPSLGERELAGLLEQRYIYAWHPGAGLIAAVDCDFLQVADLIAPLRRGQRHWNRAVPGLSIAGRMTMLAPQVELSFQQILDEARDDIGSQNEALDDLPPSPAEPSDSLLTNLGRAIVLVTAGAFLRFAKMLPFGARTSSWIDKLLQATAKNVARVTSAQEHLRNREILRLLHLLEHDPDKGLRFALPFGGAAQRGLAPPSNRLSERNVEFDLRQLGGGRPADIWKFATNHKQELLTKYRELANREMHLGRYRRAAYIFAELLGDLSAAALALSTGRHFREAAIIYRDRLQRPRDAAMCLESGGLWAEAIELYEKLDLHEKAGELHEKLGNIDEAREAFQTAARRCRAENDFLSAARIWDNKLSSPEQAISELEAGWPGSSQAIECLRTLFALLGRTGQHQAAQRRINDLLRECPRTRQYVRTAELLSELATGGYPDGGVRETATEAVQQVVSDRLHLALRSEAYRLVASLSKLAPHDRLLERDGARFAFDLPISHPLARASRTSLRKIRTIELGLPGIWQTAVVTGQAIVAAGILDHRIVLARCDFEGNRDGFIIPWSNTVVRTDSAIVLVADPTRSTSLGVYAIGEGPLLSKAGFPTNDAFIDPITIGASPAASQPLAIARGLHGHIWSIENRESPVIQVTNEQGDLVSTFRLPLDDSLDWSEVRLPLPMHVRREHLYVALGNDLLVIEQRTCEHESMEFPNAIRCFAGSAEHTHARIAIGLDIGACVLWELSGERRCVPFVNEMVAPRVGINRGGYVIAATESGLAVYDSKEGNLKFVASCNELPARPISVLAGPKTDGFAIMTQDGHVTVYEI